MKAVPLLAVALLAGCGSSAQPQTEAPTTAATAASAPATEKPKTVAELIGDVCKGTVTTGADVEALSGSWAKGDAAHCVEDDMRGVVVVKAASDGEAMNLAQAARESGEGWKYARSTGSYVCAPFGPGGGLDCPNV